MCESDAISIIYCRFKYDKVLIISNFYVIVHLTCKFAIKKLLLYI